MEPKYSIGDNVTVKPGFRNLSERAHTQSNSRMKVFEGSTFAVARVERNPSGTVKYILSGAPGWVWYEEWLTPEVTFDTPKDCVALTHGYYRPFEIKRNRKAPRKICAPSEGLLKYQRSKIKELEATFFDMEKANDIENIMHGFIKNRNCVTAAEQHIGYDLTIMMDISAFFDNVTPAHTGIHNKDFYSIDDYCAQGFATSPILANIGVVATVAWVKEYLDAVFADRYAFTMYADDIQISINSDDFESETAAIIETITAAFEFAGFEIHPHKTRIRHAKYGYRRILGVNVGDDHIRPTRKVIRRAKAAEYQTKAGLDPEKRVQAGRSLGGLRTWMRLDLPRKLRGK